MGRRSAVAVVATVAALVAVVAVTVWIARRGDTGGRQPPPFSYGPALTVTAVGTPSPPAPPSTVVPSTPPAAPTLEPPAVRRARFGVNVADGDPAQVQTLGLEWLILPDAERAAPAGTTAVRLLFIGAPPPDERLRAWARRFPGSYWLAGNEPNVKEQGNLTPEQYADALHHVAEVLKSEDPTARLAGPNVLNWTYTCDGCPGYPEGLAWTEAMRRAYLARFGAEPPLDVWTIHAYDVDWYHLPNGDAGRSIEQVRGMRAWMNGLPALRDRPLWITEAGIHWGYPGLNVRDGVAYPVGDFDYAHAEAYMRALYGWLAANGGRERIEKWFLWVLSWKKAEPWQSRWTGISLMDGPDTTAPVTPLGRLYQELAGVR